MVKITKPFTLDPEVVELLSQTHNASSLVNNLIKEHFNEAYSDNVEVLERKRADMDNEVEILRKKIEHITNKLIIISQKKKNEVHSLEYQQAMKDFNKKLEEIKARWQNDEITEEEYWKEMDEMKKQKPSK